MNTLPNDQGYGAAEIARGEMSCNDGYALHEMMPAESPVSVQSDADCDANKTIPTSEVNS